MWDHIFAQEPCLFLVHHFTLAKFLKKGKLHARKKIKWYFILHTPPSSSSCKICTYKHVRKSLFDNLPLIVTLNVFPTCRPFYYIIIIKLCQGNRIRWLTTIFGITTQLWPLLGTNMLVKYRTVFLDGDLIRVLFWMICRFFLQKDT